MICTVVVVCSCDPKFMVPTSGDNQASDENEFDIADEVAVTLDDFDLFAVEPVPYSDGAVR